MSELKDQVKASPIYAILIILGSIVCCILLIMFGIPVYKSWNANYVGNSEVSLAQKKAEAIKIVGQAARDYPEYKQQEYISAFSDAMKKGKIEQIIYVPTEAGIPVTESKK